MIFDLVFLLAAVGSAVVLLSVALELLRGRRRAAARRLGRYGIFVAIYLGAVILVSLATPQRLLGPGDDQCSDDWCIAVEKADRSLSGSEVAVTFRLSSRAQRVSQREKGVIVYLLDERGRSHEPSIDPGAVPFDTLLQPGQAVRAVRRFQVPRASGSFGIVVSRDGWNGLPRRFVLGNDGSLFHKPTIVRLR